MPLQDNHTIRSEQLREFISHRPGIFVRWGIPIFFFIVTALAAGSNYIEYPDLVNARAKINSVNPPKQIITKSGGRIIKLFYPDHSTVKKGAVIACTESTGNYSEVLVVAAIMDTLQSFADSNRLEFIPEYWQSAREPFANLGELQQAHQTFMQGFLSFTEYLKSGFYISKKQMLSKDLMNTKRLQETLKQQKQLQEEDLSLAVQNFNVHDTLHKETILNDIDYRGQKSQLISKKMTIPQANASLLNNLSQQQAIQKEILELDNQIAQQKLLFLQVLSIYRNAIEDWKQKYIITSPVDGRLEYAGFLQENQHIQTGQLIGYITSNSDEYYIEMWIPQANSGKVKQGQDVLLSFLSYPAQEFGFVKGRITFIKDIPSDSGYLSRVSLPNGLVTNYKKRIIFQEGMTAQAQIVTEKRSLLYRLFGRFNDLFK